MQYSPNYHFLWICAYHRSKSWENVYSVTNERENEENNQKKTVSKTESVGSNKTKFDDGIAFSSSNAITNGAPNHNMEASKVRKLMRLEMRRHFLCGNVEHVVITEYVITYFYIVII